MDKTLHRDRPTQLSDPSSQFLSLGRLLVSPSLALAFVFPTIGYYTVAAYASILAPEGNVAGIVTRTAALAFVVLAWFVHLRTRGIGVAIAFIPAVTFAGLYLARVAENYAFQGFEPPQGALFVAAAFLGSGLIPGVLLGMVADRLNGRQFDGAVRLFGALFLVGLALNLERLSSLSGQRIDLENVNAIALSYTAGTFILYYVVTANKNAYRIVETFIVVPILFAVVAYARSRGMLVSTAAVLLIYGVSLKGNRRWAFAGVVALAATAVAIFSPDIIDPIVVALSRINFETDMSTAIRGQLYQGAWHQFLADPLFGRYSIEMIHAYYPHNIYLEALMAVGVVGSIPLVFHLWLSFRAALGTLFQGQKSPLLTFIALLFLRDALGAVFSGAVWSVSGFWITSLVLLGWWYGPARKAAISKV